MKIFYNNSVFNNTQKYYSFLHSSHTDSPHMHEFFEIFYIVSGNIMHDHNGTCETLGMGDLYIIRPKEIHNCCNALSSNAMLRNILIHTDEFKRVCSLISPHLYNDIMAQKKLKYFISNNDIHYLETLLTQISLNQFNQFYEPMFRFALIRILEIYFVDSSKNFKLHTEPYHASTSSIINKINSPNGMLLTAGQILAQQPYVPSYICRIFKKDLGMTISQYINKQRLEYANMLMSTTNFSISAIARMVGYQNYSFFYRKYVEYYKDTPQHHNSRC